MIRRHRLGFAVAGAVVLIVAVGLIAKVKVGEAATLAKFPDRGVPRINIELSDVTLEEIKAGSKEVKYEGNKLSLYEGNGVQEFKDVRLKGRGNGTWNYEKKSYQIKFDEKVDLLGMGKAKKWVLLANAVDISNMRTELATKIEKLLGMKYIFDGEFVELYVDSEYHGLYYLTHMVEIGKTAVNLDNSMAVLVELDNLYWEKEKYYESGDGDHLVLKDVVDNDLAEQAMGDFLQNYNELESVVKEKNYARVEELVDVESFAEYYLLSEFSVNPDAYWTSFYMYKNGVNDKIHAGPGWDFDLAFANHNWKNWMGESFYSPVQTMVRRGELLPKEWYDERGLSDESVGWYHASLLLSKIMFEMMEIQEFREAVSRIYQERLSGKIEEVISDLRHRADELNEVMWNDNMRWNKGNYETEVNEMVEWTWRRYEYFEKEYGE